MLILAISDLHGDLASAHRAIERFQPDLVLCCGDWGDPAEVTESELAEFGRKRMVLTTFGNHDPLELLPRLENADRSKVLLEQGEVREVGGLRIAAIGGIWAKSHRQPHYVTDEDVAAAAQRIARLGSTDVLMTHGCPVGLADLTPRRTHGGQRCFLDANKTILPRIHLCGHLHLAQERTLKDGRQILNVGATPEGDVVVIDATDTDAVRARHERV